MNFKTKKYSALKAKVRTDRGFIIHVHLLLYVCEIIHTVDATDRILLCEPSSFTIKLWSCTNSAVVLFLKDSLF